MTLLTETRERFLLAIVDKVPAERIAEIHFFSPIKQGGIESGVAVVAAWTGDSGLGTGDSGVGTASGLEPRDPALRASSPQSRVPSPQSPVRPVVYTARYRLTLKGPDRGKWESSVVAEAEAPLVTVDAVVRGVQRRAGDVEDPTRMEGDDVRARVEMLKR
jgi:hypothetical protein